MMYPAPVNGAMPFVDSKKHREMQIKKVIAKHKARHHSGPEKYSLEKSKVHNKNAKSMPQLSPDAAASPRMRRPNFNSMPSLESSMDLTKTEQEAKHSIITAIKQLFTGKKEKKATKRYKPIYTPNTTGRVRSHSSPVDILCKSRNDVNTESNSPPGVSPKRQRTRTVSNISSIMETIEEIPENLVLEDESDSSDSCSDSDSNSSAMSSLNSLLSSASEPTYRDYVRNTSKDSLIHTCSSSEVICAA